MIIYIILDNGRGSLLNEKTDKARSGSLMDVRINKAGSGSFMSKGISKAGSNGFMSKILDNARIDSLIRKRINKANSINCAGCCGQEPCPRTTFTISPDLVSMSVGVALFAAGFATNGTLSLVLLILSWLAAGHGVLRKAISNP